MDAFSGFLRAAKARRGSQGADNMSQLEGAVAGSSCCALERLRRSLAPVSVYVGGTVWVHHRPAVEASAVELSPMRGAK